MIKAAGGVVWRREGDGQLQILVVHRPHYDDWSLPKGKLEPGESSAAGALREVREETGMRCEPGSELVTTRYRDRKGRRKRVRYWAMQVRDGAFKRNREVDAVRWIDPEKAVTLLTYRRDVRVVQSLTAAAEVSAASRTGR